LTTYESEQFSLEKERKKLDVNILSLSYQKSEKNLRLLEEQLKTMTKGTKTLIIRETEDEIREKIQEQKNSQILYEELVRQKNTVTEYLSKKHKQLQSIKDTYVSKYGKQQTEEKIMTSITELCTKISEQEKCKADTDEQLREIENWQKNNKEIQNYESWQKKVNTLIKKEKIARNKYASSTELKETILQAESIAMHQIIDSVNAHASIFLESFFPENPILVELKPEKTTKKGTTKPQVDIEVQYKGHECDLSSLSGGELARVILAYTLALAEMFNVPLILLDECTASLDEELTETVFSTIKEVFPNKTVLTIAHQLVQGSFDKVISLSNKPKVIPEKKAVTKKKTVTKKKK